MRKILIGSVIVLSVLFVILISAALIYYYYLCMGCGGEDPDFEKRIPVEKQTPKPADKKKNTEKDLEELKKISFEKGRKQAESDIQNGILIVYQNRIEGASREYQEFMLKKYGVRIIEGGDSVTFEGLAFNSGYNSVSKPAIEKKFGTGIIERVEKELKTKENN